ncbi:MAG: alcohol dehydrogenase catalytic domain-containing protein [Caldimicrobium sp.]
MKYNNEEPMKAWFIQKIGPLSRESLILKEVPNPSIGPKEILIKVKACGVCHTEIDEIEGRAMVSFLPIIPGHQIVGEVIEVGKEVKKFSIGDLVGVGWIYDACGNCKYCKEGLENLCKDFKGTGKDAHGGYAEFFKISEDFAFHLPKEIMPEKLAPLLCAGAIGYRALKLVSIKDGDILGLIGFGASNHLVLKLVKKLYPKVTVFVFTRNPVERELASSLGAEAFELYKEPPQLVSGLIDTTPVWKPPFFYLRYLKPGGRLIINAIRKESQDKDFLQELIYERDFWLEKEIKSVANITRRDLQEFLELAIKYRIEPEIEIYPFDEAIQALLDIKSRKIRGAKVLKIS